MAIGPFQLFYIHHLANKDSWKVKEANQHTKAPIQSRSFEVQDKFLASFGKQEPKLSLFMGQMFFLFVCAITH
jgi:hypothetical protein